MTASPAHAALFTPLNWDPDLLPPLEMDGYLTGTLVTPELEVTDWVADLWTAIPPVTYQARMKQALAAVLARRKAIEADLQKGWPACGATIWIRKPDNQDQNP
jgi:uncharacterized protein